jgi:hypothetical protein
MPRTDQEIKAAIVAQVEEYLDKVLAKYRTKGETITLSDIERMALQASDQTGQAITAELVNSQEDKQLVPGPICEGCGVEMRYKGKKRKKVQTLSGEVEVERSYYYCATCQRGIFPPG